MQKLKLPRSGVWTPCFKNHTDNAVIQNTNCDDSDDRFFSEIDPTIPFSVDSEVQTWIDAERF